MSRISGKLRSDYLSLADSNGLVSIGRCSKKFKVVELKKDCAQLLCYCGKSQVIVLALTLASDRNEISATGKR